MKRILFACLLGMASLLPSNKISAATPSAAASRIIDCYVQGIVLIATSDESTGTLVSITIFNTSNQEVRNTTCSGYSCSVSLVNLRSGHYTAHVVATNGSYNEEFNI